MFRTPTILAGATLAVALAACSSLTPAPAPAAVAPVGESLVAHPLPTNLTGYLAVGAIDAAALLGPPPELDSLRGQADRTRYLETRSLEGSPRWSQAIVDNDLWGGGALKQYACKMGVAIDAKHTPATLRVLERVELDVRTVSKPAKDHYNRPRPMVGDDRAVCVPREDWMKTNAGYPSGHAMTGWAWALILAELKPAKTDGLLAVGKSVGDSRAICGVHYPSDIEAGRTLGSAMVAALHGDPAFQSDMRRARAEIGRVKAAPQDCGV